MKKNLFSILLVVVMTLAMVACGTQETTNDVPVSTETIEATVESDENSEAVSETEQATEAPVDEVVETVDETVESESSEATSETESDEVASTPDSEAVNEASEPETTVPEFTVTEVTATKYATQSVNVRSGPSTDYDKIGGLTTNQEVQVTGQASTGWYRFTWTDGREAYVSDKYLSDSKVEVAPPASNNSGSGNTASNTGSASGAFNEDEYYPGQIINKGGINVYCVMGGNTGVDELSQQCEAIVAQNLGIELMHTGGGTYYWFNGGGYINGQWIINQNANGAKGLFFPSYAAADGTYLGEPADTRMN